MAMDVNIKELRNIDPLTIKPLTIADIKHVAPIAVHLKELNQIAPLFVESLRVDQVRNIDPLRIDRLNITQLPSVSLSLSQLPSLDLNVRRVPPMAISLQQRFELNSQYTITTRILGVPLMRMQLSGVTQMTPRDCARREQSQSHEKSFPDVAAAGNPAISSCTTETSRRVVVPCAPPPRTQRPINAGAPRFQYHLHRKPDRTMQSGSSVSAGS